LVEAARDLGDALDHGAAERARPAPQRVVVIARRTGPWSSSAASDEPAFCNEGRSIRELWS
jgi:hypothetical protein